MKHFNIFGFTEKSDFQGGVTKNYYIGGIGQFSDLRGGGLDKKERVVFLSGGGVYTPMHTIFLSTEAAPYLYKSTLFPAWNT